MSEPLPKWSAGSAHPEARELHRRAAAARNKLRKMCEGDPYLIIAELEDAVRTLARRPLEQERDNWAEQSAIEAGYAALQERRAEAAEKLRPARTPPTARSQRRAGLWDERALGRQLARLTHCPACKQAGISPKRGKGIRIVFDPGIQMPGSPTIEGHRLAAEQIAGLMYNYGWDETGDAYDLTHEEVVVACWWAAHWGPRKLRKAWGEWGRDAGTHLWYGCINVSLPPTRAEIEALT